MNPLAGAHHPPRVSNKSCVIDCCSRLVPVLGLALVLLGTIALKNPAVMSKTWSIVTCASGGVILLAYTCLRCCNCIGAARESRRAQIGVLNELMYQYGMEQSLVDQGIDPRMHAGASDAEEDPEDIEEGVRCLKELYSNFDALAKSQFLKADDSLDIPNMVKLVVKRYVTGDKSRSEIPSFFKESTRTNIQALRNKDQKQITEKDLQEASFEETKGVLVKQCWQQASEELLDEFPNDLLEDNDSLDGVNNP